MLRFGTRCRLAAVEACQAAADSEHGPCHTGSGLVVVVGSLHTIAAVVEDTCLVAAADTAHWDPGGIRVVVDQLAVLSHQAT